MDRSRLNKTNVPNWTEQNFSGQNGLNRTEWTAYDQIGPKKIEQAEQNQFRQNKNFEFLSFLLHF